MLKFLNHAFKKNKTYLVLLFLNIISGIAGLLIYKFISFKYSGDGLFIFTYLKRIISFVSPISLLGLGVTLARYVAANNKNSYKYVLNSILAALFIPFVLLIIYLAFPAYLTKLLWGEDLKQYSEMILPIVINILGLNLISILVSFYRGLGKFVFSTSLSLFFIVLLPFFILFFNVPLKNFISYYGVLLVLISLLLLFKISRKYSTMEKINFKMFFIEGSSRMIGDISYYFLLFAPSYFLLKYTNDLVLASSIAFCQVIINASSILINPISFVSLTNSVKNINDNKINKLKRDFFSFVRNCFLFFITILIILCITLEYIIPLLYSQKILDYNNEIKLFLISLPFIAVFLGARSFVDGITSKAIMSYVNTFGLFVFLLLFFLLKNFTTVFNSIGFSFVTSFFLMDLLIILYLKRTK